MNHHIRTLPEATPATTSTIASALQQMSMSLGVAAASLAAAFFILDHFEMIHGHLQFIALGGLTILPALVFH